MSLAIVLSFQHTVLPIHFAAVADPNHQDKHAVIEDAIDDPVIANTYPIGVLLTGQLLNTVRTRIICQGFGVYDDPRLDRFGKLGDLPICSRGEPYLVRHL